MTTPLFNILERNLAVPDEDKVQMRPRSRATAAQIADAVMRVDVLMKSGQCTLIKDACLIVSGETGVPLTTLKVKYSRQNRQ